MDCEICGNELEDWEDGICDDCQSSIILTDNLFPSESDF